MEHKPSEKACADRFIWWYNAKNGSNYRCCEAEEYFPELKKNKGKKWDYVALQEADSTWIAVEVKHVPRHPGLDRGSLDWRKFCQQVTNDIQGKVSGTYGLTFPPPPDFRQNQKRTLSRAIATVIAEAAPTMSVGSPEKDLSTEIGIKFPNWPQRQWRDITEYDKWGEYRPYELQVYKESDEGCQVKLAALSNGAYDVVADHNQALDEVFNPNNPDRMKANVQLAAAKEKGAEKTILLLDCAFCNDDLVRNYVKLLDPAAICNIDCIYLAGSGDSQFTRVL